MKEEESSDVDDGDEGESQMEKFMEALGGEMERSVVSEDTTVKQMRKKQKAIMRKKAREEKARNKFMAKRDNMKKKIVKTVLDKVLPDVGAYDASG